MNKRTRRGGFVTSDKSAAFADLLYHIVVKLDCGEAAYLLADDVETLGRAMKR